MSQYLDYIRHSNEPTRKKKKKGRKSCRKMGKDKRYK